MFTSARAAAVDHLLRIEVSHAHVARLDAGLPPREERQVTEYVAGVTRWRRWLDFLLAGLYRGPYHEMEPMLRQILRLGAYDLLLQQTPAHAAIHEAVELAKHRLRPGAGKLANGLLRTLDRRQDNLPEPDTGDPVRDLAIRHSHPTWVVRRWVGRMGPEAARALVDWNNARPAYDLRVNTLRQTPEAFRQALEALDVTATPSPFLEAFVRVDRLQPIVQAGWLGEGGCAVQDQSAGLVVHLLDPQPHEQVLDVCAAPGGK
ncbi:MAG: transcription antitermination factor NusB, partial [Bacteroidota bacterium]